MEVRSRIYFLKITIATTAMCAATAVIPVCGVQARHPVSICMTIVRIIRANEKRRKSTTTVYICCSKGSKCE